MVALVLILVVATLATAVVALGMPRSSTPSTTQSTSYSSSTTASVTNSSSETPAVLTTEYSSFNLIPGFGNGTTQFEGNDEHVYNYTWTGGVASFEISLDGSVIAPPTLYEGLLLADLSVNATSGGVAAINMVNGTLVWETEFPNMVMTQPITYQGLVIVGLGNNVFQGTTVTVRGSGTNYVAALNASTGSLVWTYATSGEDMPTPLIYDGLVIGANGDGSVYALGALSGQEVWNLSLSLGSYVSMSSPAILGSSIFFGAADPYTLYSVDVATGQVSWATNVLATGGLDDCSPAIWNNVLVTGYTALTNNGTLEPVLLGVNASNGEVLWYQGESAGAVPPAIENPPVTIWNGIAYSDPTESGILYAVNATSGALLWTFDTGSDTSNANVYEGYLSLVNETGTMFVLNPTTGALIKTTDVGAGLGPGSLVFVGQNVIIAGTNGLVVSTPLSDVYPGAG